MLIRPLVARVSGGGSAWTTPRARRSQDGAKPIRREELDFQPGGEAPCAPATAAAAPQPAAPPGGVGVPWRRLLFAAPVALLAAAYAALASGVADTASFPLLDGALLAILAVAMGWEAYVGWQLVLGFALDRLGRHSRRALFPLEARADEVRPIATGRSRTAVLVPVHNEDPAAVYAAVRVMARSLAATGACPDIDVHVLSDTRDPATAAAEEAEHARALAWARRQPRGLPRLHYRRRPVNTGRKAGNIAEFCERSGLLYDFMVVLDADSLMTGGAVRRLIRLMEENPRLGLVQTVSWPANRDTLFARIQQFAIRLHAPLPLRGLAFWQAADGSYWGHNAIIRVAAFAEHCRLPVLPGKPPLGGEILCHDIVEGALLRRAGWDVVLLPELEGTWEEMPTNLVDLMGRERRWCQGNLQHLRVLAIPGLRAASRAHIATGIMGYLVSPLWLAFLVLGAIRALATPEGEGLGLLAYGITEEGPAAAALLAASAALILAPRALNLGRALLDPATRRGFGGTGRFLASASLEQAFSLLLGPVFTVMHTRLVASTLAGRVVSWSGQSRADRVVGWAEACRLYALPSAVGVASALVAWRVGGWYALWMAPFAAGLLLGPALAAWSSRADLGRRSRRLGLFLTPDETAPARELRELRAASLAPVAPPRDPGPPPPALPPVAAGAI